MLVVGCQNSMGATLGVTTFPNSGKLTLKRVGSIGINPWVRIPAFPLAWVLLTWVSVS